MIEINTKIWSFHFGINDLRKDTMSSGSNERIWRIIGRAGWETRFINLLYRSYINVCIYEEKLQTNIAAFNAHDR